MKDRRHLISFFSGALGLDLGLEKAGFILKAVVECNQIPIQTIRNNSKHLKGKKFVIIDKALSPKNVDAICKDILKRTRLKKTSPYLLAGAPPCQPFSTVGKRASMQDSRSCGFEIILQAVNILRPKFFVIENVKGILSAARRHRPLAERGPGFPKLKPSEEHGSAFRDLLDSIDALCQSVGYCVSWGVVNSADYGNPQIRERVVFIGSLDGHFIWPKPTHSKDGKGGMKKWTTLRTGLKGSNEQSPAYRPFTETVADYLKLVPQGGNWRDLPERLKADAIGRAYDSWGGRSGFLRRLSWDKPAPTITGHPNTRATMLCHPTQTRPLSMRECARIQQFPDNWEFSGSVSQQYMQIGNATPVALGEAIGRAIIAADNKNNETHKKQLYCADAELLRRIIERPKTVLNPQRMRKYKSVKKTAEWLNGTRRRKEFQKYKSMALVKA